MNAEIKNITMTKSILIGNGFTSYLICDYSNSHMREELLKYCCKDYLYINELFNNFRMSGFKNVYGYDDELKYSDNLFQGDDIYSEPDVKSLYNINIVQYVINKLNEIGFQNCESIFDIYFVQYGLIFEVIREGEETDLDSIENLLKVIDLFRKIGKIDEEQEKKIKKVANKIYYNEGKCGLKDTNLTDYSMIINFFKSFDFVFTTNYDLILDDICDNEGKVFHLHGSYNIRKVNEPGKVYYIKDDKRLTDTESHIIWGLNSEEKLKDMKAGMTFPFTFPITFPISIFDEYFDKLENENINEIHIFGYSGENDQHINKRIIANKALEKIYFYCDPKDIGKCNDERKVKNLFKDTKQRSFLNHGKKYGHVYDDRQLIECQLCILVGIR